MLSLLLAATAPVTVVSPDNSIVISVAPDGQSYSVTRKGETIVKDAPLGLDIANESDFSKLQLVDVRTQTVDRTIPLTATKADRQRVVTGKSVSVRVDIGGRRIIKKKQ